MLQVVQNTNWIHTIGDIMCIRNCWETVIIQGSSYLCWPVEGAALHGVWCTTRCEVHTNFVNESVRLMADNVWNEGKLVTNLWTAWQHYVSRHAVWFIHGNLFMICQQWVAVISSISCFSQLQLVSSVLQQGVVYFRAIFISAWHLCEIQIC
jgi:hypothetical protein